MMNDDKLTEFIIEIKAKLSSIDAKVDGVLETLKNHETRLQTIENKGSDGGFKSDLVGLLVKCLVFAIAIIASLTGSAGLIKEIFTK